LQSAMPTAVNLVVLVTEFGRRRVARTDHFYAYGFPLPSAGQLLEVYSP